MVQTFLYRTETPDKKYHHTIHSVNILSSVEKWVIKMEDLQDESYSFNKNQVGNIKQQFLNRQLKMQLDKEPYFLTYKAGDKIQVVQIDKVIKSEPDFIAKLTYLTTGEGGRIRNAMSGYRAQIKFDGRNQLTSGEQLFVDKDKVFPGETVTAEIRMLSPHLFEKFLFVGQSLEIRESATTVAHGEVLEIINPTLRKSSQ